MISASILFSCSNQVECMERVEFENSRGLTLVGNFWSADSDAGIVMAHGFTGNKEEWGKFTEIADSLNSIGYNVLSFDFSGCGESGDDSITIEKEVDDLGSAIEFCRSQGVERFGLFGLSQGGLIALKNYRENVKTVVLVAPLTHKIEDYRDRKLSDEQVRELEEKEYTVRTREKGNRDEFIIPKQVIERKESLDQDKILQDIECPVLIIHGSEDETVPLEHSRKAVEKLEQAELEVINDDHYFEDSVDQVASSAENWFKKHLKP